MTDIITGAYAKNVTANIESADVQRILEVAVDIIDCPIHIVRVAPNEEFHGECETRFDGYGFAVEHVIKLAVLNDGVLCHELGHALANETLNYDELVHLDGHGAHFCEAVAMIVKRLEG